MGFFTNFAIIPPEELVVDSVQDQPSFLIPAPKGLWAELEKYQ